MKEDNIAGVCICTQFNQRRNVVRRRRSRNGESKKYQEPRWGKPAKRMKRLFYRKIAYLREYRWDR